METIRDSVEITPIVFEAQLDSFAYEFLKMRILHLSDHERKELQTAAIKGKKVSVALVIFDE